MRKETRKGRSEEWEEKSKEREMEELLLLSTQCVMVDSVHKLPVSAITILMCVSTSLIPRPVPFSAV